MTPEEVNLKVEHEKDFRIIILTKLDSIDKSVTDLKVKVAISAVTISAITSYLVLSFGK